MSSLKPPASPPQMDKTINVTNINITGSFYVQDDAGHYIVGNHTINESTGTFSGGINSAMNTLLEGSISVDNIAFTVPFSVMGIHKDVPVTLSLSAVKNLEVFLYPGTNVDQPAELSGAVKDGDGQDLYTFDQTGSLMSLTIPDNWIGDWSISLVGSAKVTGQTNWTLYVTASTTFTVASLDSVSSGGPPPPTAQPDKWIRVPNPQASQGIKITGTLYVQDAAGNYIVGNLPFNETGSFDAEYYSDFNRLSSAGIGVDDIALTIPIPLVGNLQVTYSWYADMHASAGVSSPGTYSGQWGELSGGIEKDGNDLYVWDEGGSCPMSVTIPNGWIGDWSMSFEGSASVTQSGTGTIFGRVHIKASTTFTVTGSDFSKF